MADVSVKRSKIDKKGVFAARDFKKGEIVLKWHSPILTKEKADTLSERDRHYLCQFRKKYLLMQPPERYVNHSCEPNTKTGDYSDVAKRDIEKGEEITTDYGHGVPVPFRCRCGSKKCRGIIK